VKENARNKIAEWFREINEKEITELEEKIF
jgi:hypothetical protein